MLVKLTIGVQKVPLESIEPGGLFIDSNSPYRRLYLGVGVGITCDADKIPVCFMPTGSVFTLRKDSLVSPATQLSPLEIGARTECVRYAGNDNE